MASRPLSRKIVIAVGVAVALGLDPSTWWAWVLLASSAAIDVVRLVSAGPGQSTYPSCGPPLGRVGHGGGPIAP